MLETPSDKDNTETAPDNTSAPKDNPPKIESPVQAQEKDVQHITGIRLLSVLFALALVAFLVMLDQTIVVTALPKISVQFHSLKDIGWYGSAYLLTNASMQPLMGKIYQYYSSKIVFLSCLSIFELGSLICGVAQSSIVLIIGRAIAGVGGAGLLIGIISIISTSAPIDKRPMYLGSTLGLASIGLVCGPILGGVFTEYASWRWCFFINLPIGAITICIISFINIPTSHVQSKTKKTFLEHLQCLDLPGCAAFTPAIVMLLLAIQWGGVTYKWNSATIIGLFCGFGVAMALFIFIEKRAGQGAMIPLASIYQRKVICAGAVAFFSSGGNLLIAYYLPIWFQVVQNASPTMGGIRLLPTIGALSFGSMAAGALVTRTGYFTPFAILGSALSAIGTGLLVTLSLNSGAGMWAGFQVIAGLGRGMTMQQGITAVQAALSPEMQPIGTAFIMFIQILGGTVFISFGQTIFTNQLKTALAHFATTVDSGKILESGVTAFRTVVSPSQVHGVLLAYNHALTQIYYLSVAACCISFVAAFGLGWTNIKTKKSPESIEEKV